MSWRRFSPPCTGRCRILLQLDSDVRVHCLLPCVAKLVVRKFFPFDVVDACDHCHLVVEHRFFAVVVCDVCVRVCPAAQLWQ